MRKVLILVLILVIILSSYNIKANELEIESPSAYILEYSTKEVVYKKEAETKMYPASMTKMMSLLLIYEAIENHKLSFDDMVVCSEYASSMGGSQIYLKENEEMKVIDLIKSICIASANDAVVALAEKLYGSEENFVREMNLKAKQLNLINTNFMNASGLHHDKHYSCAKDMATIAYHLIETGGKHLLNITSTYEDYIREDTNSFWLVNTNKLIRSYKGVDGLKTGFTSQAGSCISVTINRNNIRFIAVIMGAATSVKRNEEIIKLLEYAYSLYDTKLIYKKNDYIKTIKNQSLIPSTYNLLCEDDISIVYKKNKEPKIISSEIKWLNKKEPYKSKERVAKLIFELNNGNKYSAYLICDRSLKPLTIIDLVLKGLIQYL